MHDPSVYDAQYFGADRDPLDRMGLSGYERYDRSTSNADAAAYLVWRWLPVRDALDVGCAMGFVVESLREMGIAARGVDVSEYAVRHAAPGARGHIQQGDLSTGLPFADRAFDVVTTFETLEHLPPDAVPAALREIARVTSNFVVATIPSFGTNDHGPGGWFESKVPDDRLAHYYAQGADYDGPVPFDDIIRDVDGRPKEGHLTVASFAWWTAQFSAVGLERCGAIECEMNQSITRFGLGKYWNLYVLRRVDASGVMPGSGSVQDAASIRAMEARLHLDTRSADEWDLERLRTALRLPPGTPLL